MKIYSWNVNGIRACLKAGFLQWLQESDADVVLLQEVRALSEQVPLELLNFPGFQNHWHAAEKKGYSGVAIFTKRPVKSVDLGMQLPQFDVEGRLLAVTIGDLYCVSCYFPNSQDGGKRLDYKLEFCKQLKKHLDAKRAQGLHVIIGGDFNIAHQPIDLAHPKQNEKNAGYLPEERAWMSEFLAKDYCDTFRMFQQEGGQYSWWSNRPGVRERNIGWRIDYHCVSHELKSRVKRAEIHSHVMGSDHCPVFLELQETH